ncbi:MAG: DUF2510 domain-containing protein [Brooklawnia sp.]|jgi:hypothetical protein
MTMPGWYPDPAGGSGQYRFWDGDSWSNHTTQDPGTPPPGRPTPRSPQGNARQATWLIIAVAAVAVLGLIAWLVFGGGSPTSPSRGQPAQEDSNSSTPTVQGWDETSKPTPPPTEQADLVDCPVTMVDQVTDQGNDGRLHSDKLSVEMIPGWRYDSFYLQWVSDTHTVIDFVRDGWISNIGVGTLNAVDGFVSPETSARQTLECFASSGYYLNYTHRVDLINEATTVSGYPAWRMRSEVHIDSGYMPEIDGDVVDIIVVDLGDPERMGLFVSSVTIGDTARQEKVDAAITTLRVG